MDKLDNNVMSYSEVWSKEGVTVYGHASKCT